MMNLHTLNFSKIFQQEFRSSLDSYADELTVLIRTRAKVYFSVAQAKQAVADNWLLVVPQNVCNDMIIQIRKST